MAGIKACRAGRNIRSSCLQPLDTSSPLVSRRENMPSPLFCVEGKPLLTPKNNKSQAEVFEQYASFTLEDCSYSLFDTGEGTEGPVGGPRSATVAPGARAVCAETNAGKGCGLPSVQDCPVSSVDKKVTMAMSKRITRSMQPQVRILNPTDIWHVQCLNSKSFHNRCCYLINIQMLNKQMILFATSSDSISGSGSVQV